MSEVPGWMLFGFYWLHMLATVIWIGGLASINFLIFPTIAQLDSLETRVSLLEKVQRRLDPMAWFALLILLGTGMVQMSVNPNYEGFLAISNQWAMSILLKHVVFIGMIALGAYITWVALPDLRRKMVRLTKGKAVMDIDQVLLRNTWLLRINLILGVIVLAFTAIARASL